MGKKLFNVLIFFFIGYSLGAEVRITNATSFSIFVNNVNIKRTTYEGTTVFLDSDLSLAEYTIDPIGNSSSYPYYQFLGVFDGQGYVISNFNITNSSSYTGLFGYSKGLTIKNVVLDSSCFLSNTYNGYNIYFGGIIGYCYSSSGECNIESNVNMANVTFSGDTSSYSLYLGGIAGYLESSYNYKSTVKNCANYGSVTHSGTSSNSYIGGIAGNLYYPYYKHIYNCLNYGTITHSGTTSDYLYLGGIVGYTEYVYIENCVSAGRISSSSTAKYIRVGSLVGSVNSETYVNYCYYTNGLNGYKLYGDGTPANTYCTSYYRANTFELNETISIGNNTEDTLINVLNSASVYYILRGYSHWLLNKNNRTVSFTINGRANPIKMDFQIILLPSLASEGNLWFNGWYNDSEYESLLTVPDVTSGTSLYGKHENNTNNFTITFNTRGGTPVYPISAQFGINVSLPSSSTRDCCTVGYWETIYGDNVGLSLVIPAHNITLYAVWKCSHIKSPDDFLDFSKVVNTGMTYYGTTVFLDSDLSLSGYTTINPIGYDSGYYFRGVFDGQGHVISNLKISSSSLYVGLFGYSTGLTIKNVVLDSSCSITSTYKNYDNIYLGGIIGYCFSYNGGQCIIENNVNMANVSFSGSISTYDELHLGGIVGYLANTYYTYVTTVKNCANYGSVTHSKTNRHCSYIGGVVGSLANHQYKYAYNCLNYGTITHSGSTTNCFYLGGIVGFTWYAYIENCVSAGMISPSSKHCDIGSLVGFAEYGTYINYCYYTNGLSDYELYGFGTPMSESNTLSYRNNTFELNGTVSIGNYSKDSLIDALNTYSDYYMLRDYSHWLLNKNNKTVSFTINGRANPIKMDFQIILLPSLASEGNLWFNGWYNDSEYESVFIMPEIMNDTSLYSKFDINTNNYTITFNTRSGSPVDPISAQFGAKVSLPSNSTRDCCTFSFWESEKGYNVGLSLVMPARNITLYAVWKCTHIKTPDDFLGFLKTVNIGSTYSGSTVLLDSDLSLSGYTIINSIGYDSYYPYQFRGVFDGQGHAISNLKISSSSLYVGLFGYSTGLTIKNVVLDSSCSITKSNINYNKVYFGGIIGYCSGQCNIENNVNMASIFFSGSISNYGGLCLGGIAGNLQSSSSNIIHVKNCANYGSITHSGNNYRSYIGGIVGNLDGSYYKYIYNCLNYGTITHNGTTSVILNLGGIAGYAYYAHIENCVSAGKINSNKQSRSCYIGSLVGYVDSNITINYCYYTSDVDKYGMYGSGTPANISNTPNIPSEVNSTLITNLNNQVTSENGWNKWLLNMNNETITFKVNNNIGFSLSSQIVLLHNIVVNNSFVFSGWYTDPYYDILFQSDKVSESMILYSLYGEVVNVSFNTTMGNVAINSKKATVNNSYGELPTPTMTGYTFFGWFINENERILNETKVTITYNHTLYGQFIINNYTITFDFNNGTDPEERILIYNSTVIYPNIIEREGYTSNGWDHENIKRVPANDLTITALWTINNYTITFNFSNGTDPEVRILDYNSTINYPNIIEREGYTSRWDKGDIVFMPAENIIITVQWIPNNYTVALDSNGGCWLDKEEITVTFNSKYENLPIPNRTGYTFIGWLVSNGTDDENIENEENIIVHKNDTVNITSNCTFVALWIVNNYTVIFNYPNDENKKYTLSYGVPIEANISSPSKPFYTFDRWCTEDGKICTPDGKVPPYDITLFPHFTLNIAAVSGTAVGIVAFPFLVLLVIIFIIIILMVKNGMNIGHEAADVEMTFVNKDSGEDNKRLIEQIESTKISENFEDKLIRCNKNIEKNKPINEVLDNLGIDSSDNKYSITESFKVAGVSPVISNGIFSGTYLNAVSSYLSLLFTNVREQEEFEEFKKLYFGMKEVDAFIVRKDEEEISFGSIISGFTDKKKVIRLLSENEEDNLPRGVLFKVQNGKGYNVGGQDEILFEMNSKFKIERVEEVIKNRYIVVKLSYVSPNSDNEMTSF